MTTLELYRKHKSGEVSREKFLYEVRRDNNLPFITNLTSYDDAVKILKNKGIVTEVDTKEAKADEAVKAEVKAKAPSTKKPKELHIDQANPYEYRHGLQYELEKLDDYSDEALEKAKSTVLKNLAKDVNFYSTLLNQKQSHYKFKQTETDAPGMQANADGTLKKGAGKLDKANVQDSLGKKEAGKKKPKGVKVMPDKGVTGSEKTIKENLINEVILKVYHYDPSSGDLEDVDVEFFSSEEEAKKAALAHHWQISFENGDTNLSKEEFIAQTDFNDLQPYENYDYVIAPDKGNIKEGIEVKQDNDQIEISADSGEYAGFVENGKVSFSVVYDDVENEFGEEGITEDNWKEVLGSDHAFVQIIDKIGGDVEAAGDYVQITVDADKLKTIKENIEEANPNYMPAIGSTAATSAEDEFNQLMSKYDWYYEMSDDPRVYDRGSDMDKKLKMLGKQLGADKAVAMFNAKAPSDRKVTTSWFMEAKEDKHAKLKEVLKAKVKEAISASELIQAKQKGQIVKIPKSSTQDIQAAEKAKANYSTYE